MESLGGQAPPNIFFLEPRLTVSVYVSLWASRSFILNFHPHNTRSPQRTLPMVNSDWLRICLASVHYRPFALRSVKRHAWTISVSTLSTVWFCACTSIITRDEVVQLIPRSIRPGGTTNNQFHSCVHPPCKEIAQHSELYRKIGSIQVLYGNFFMLRRHHAQHILCQMADPQSSHIQLVNSSCIHHLINHCTYWNGDYFDHVTDNYQPCSYSWVTWVIICVKGVRAVFRRKVLATQAVFYCSLSRRGDMFDKHTRMSSSTFSLDLLVFIAVTAENAVPHE